MIFCDVGAALVAASAAQRTKALQAGRREWDPTGGRGRDPGFDEPEILPCVKPMPCRVLDEPRVRKCHRAPIRFEPLQELDAAAERLV